MMRLNFDMDHKNLRNWLLSNLNIFPQETIFVMVEREREAFLTNIDEYCFDSQGAHCKGHILQSV
jgi:hypothetical protein